jgi:Tetratricopeptide repeat
MTDPKRWLDDGASCDVEHLVRAAQAEQPDGASLGRALAAVGIGLGATSAAASAKAAGTAASLGATAQLTVTASMLAKWTALGAIVATLTLGAAKLALEAPPPSPASASSIELSARRLPGALPSAARATPQPVSATPHAGDTLPVAPPATRLPPLARVSPSRDGALGSTPSLARADAPGESLASGQQAPVDAETLAQQVRSIDRARAALAAGQAAQALAVLDDYERRFPQRGFAPEALYLRMEALSALGKTEEAREAAERLLASYPHSLHGSRARALLSKNP